MPKAKKNKPDDKTTNMYTFAFYGSGIGIYSITAVKGLSMQAGIQIERIFFSIYDNIKSVYEMRIAAENMYFGCQ